MPKDVKKSGKMNALTLWTTVELLRANKKLNLCYDQKLHGPKMANDPILDVSIEFEEGIHIH